MSLAAETRDAVRDRPFLHDALRAGVLNYAAAARQLDVEGDPEAIAAALRRFEGELESSQDDPGAMPAVRMERGLEAVDGDGVLGVDGTGYAPGDGAFTAVLATGDAGVRALETVLGALRTRDIPVEAAGVTADALVVVVERGDGPDALRAIEGSL